MATVIREEKYILYLATEEHILRVQELVWGLEPWPEKFRALLPESPRWTATMVYGSSGREAVGQAMEYLSLYSVPCIPPPHSKPR
jgi:phenylacetate-coenzyme A ligase PaaK-like adenylate-forming protein